MAALASDVPGRVRATAADAVAAVTRPDAFFAGRTDPSVRRAGAVVAAVGVVASTQAAAVNAQFAPLMPALVFVGWMAGVTLFVAASMVAFWLAVTAVLYVVSYPLAGRGGGRALLAYAGWGLVPRAGAALLVAVATAVAAGQVAGPDPAAVQGFLDRIEGEPVVALSAVAGAASATTTGTTALLRDGLGVVAQAWTWYVWVAALQHARGLGRREAALAAAVPAVGELVWHLG